MTDKNIVEFTKKGLLKRLGFEVEEIDRIFYEEEIETLFLRFKE